MYVYLNFNVHEKIESTLPWEGNLLHETIVHIVPLVPATRECDVVSVPLHTHVRRRGQESVLDTSHLYVFREGYETLLIETHHEHTGEGGEHVPCGRHVVCVSSVVDVIRQCVPLETFLEHRLEILPTHGTHEVDAEIFFVRLLPPGIDGLLHLLPIEQGLQFGGPAFEDVYDAQDGLLHVVLLSEGEPREMLLEHNEEGTRIEGRALFRGRHVVRQVKERLREFARPSVPNVCEQWD